MAFDFLERAAFGFGDEEANEQARSKAHRGVNPKGSRRPDQRAFLEHGECLCHDITRNPNSEGSDRHRTAANFAGKDFGAKYPADGSDGHGKGRGEDDDA